jgi:hypothetical protein
MPRALPLLSVGRLLPAGLLLAAGLLASPAARGAEDPLSRTFQDQNFRLTLPSSEWEWLAVTPAEAANKYHARVVRRIAGQSNSYVEAFVYVGPTNGLTMGEFVAEMTAVAKADFDKVAESKSQPVKLSGLDGRRILVKGTAKGGGVGYYPWYVVEKSGTFHGLLVKAYNGAEEDLAAEMDALRRGYRLIKGAGPEEPAPAAPPAAPRAAKEGEPKKEEEAKKGQITLNFVSPESWPATGPKREGSTVTFPTWNFSWTLPEGGPWQITGVTPDESGKGPVGLKVAARIPAPKPEKPPEGEPERPASDAQCEVLLLMREADGGILPHEILQRDQLQANIAANVFDKADVRDRRTEKDVAIGNLRGAAMRMAGTKDDRPKFHRMYIAHLRGKHYQWEAHIVGDKHADTVASEALKALMAGVRFLDTSEPVRGPWAVEGVPHAVVAHAAAPAASEIRVGFRFKPPKDVQEVDVKENQGVAGLQAALESRSPDGKAYLFVDVSARKEATMASTKQTPEMLVQERKGKWESEATDPVTAVKGKDVHFDASFASAKGIGYRFTGTFQGTPVVEKGFVVKGKAHVFWVRQQFVGADAEKTMAPVAKAIEKAIKFDK